MSESRINPLPENQEPVAGANNMPIGLVLVFAVVSYVGCNVVDRSDGSFSAKVYAPYSEEAELVAMLAKTPYEIQLERGATIYANKCATCHQKTGLGSASQGYPPLAESDWVLVDKPDRIIRIVNNGLMGPITVNGQSYNNQMPNIGNSLSDDELADLLTYIRGNANWGNSVQAVSAEQVKIVREEVSGRSAAWTEAELLEIPIEE